MYTYGDSNWGDKLSSYRGQTINYDEIGNPLSYYNGKRYTFTWGAGENLRRAVVGTNELVYTYNHNGLPTTKDIIYVGANNEIVTITHKYRYDGNRMITEEWTDENGCAHTLVYLYDADTSPIGMQYRNNQDYMDGEFDTYWFEKNLQGDIVAIYNSAGTKMISYNYDAWGNFSTSYYNGCTASDVASYNPFLYRGYYYDFELAMYYVQNRYYDLVIGRYVSPLSITINSITNGYNGYVYVIDNPISIMYSGYVAGGTTYYEAADSAGNSFVGSYPYLCPNNPTGVFNGNTIILNIVKDVSLSIAEVADRMYWGLTKDGRTFSTIHSLLEGVNGYTVFDTLPSKSGKIFKNIGIVFAGLDVAEAVWKSVQSGHSFEQGAINVALTAGKNFIAYKASTFITTAAGTWVGAKLGASLGVYAGPIGLAVGAVAGAAVGIVIDIAGNWIISGVVGWLD